MFDTENILHWSTLQLKVAVASSFCAIIATHVLTLIKNSELRGQTFVHAHTLLSCVYHMFTLDVTHWKNCIRFYPSISGKAWEQG